MKNFNKFLFAGIAAVCLVGFASCDEEETYDFPGDPYNRVYFQDGSNNYKVVITPISVIGNMNYQTIAKCTQPASEQITVTFSCDEDMLTEYNAKNGTEYLLLPDNCYEMTNKTLTIPAGAYQTKDTLRITTTEAAGQLDVEKQYMIPLRITDTEGGSAEASTNINYTYLTVSLTEDNVNHDMTVDDLESLTELTDKSAWTATTTGSQSNIARMIDGNNSNYGRVQHNNNVPTSANVTFDLGAEYEVSALYPMYYSSWYGAYSYIYMTGDAAHFYYSSDGENWKEAGSVERENNNSPVVGFYAPIKMRYVKIVVDPMSAYAAYGDSYKYYSYLYISEFRVYTK